MAIVISLLTGLLAGIFGGMFGIGGATILIPAYIYFFRFSQHQAQGTAIAAHAVNEFLEGRDLLITVPCRVNHASIN